MLFVVSVDRNIFHASGWSFLSERASDLCNVGGGFSSLCFFLKHLNSLAVPTKWPR